MPRQGGIGDNVPTLCLLHCCCTAEPVLTRATKHTRSVKHMCRGFWPTWIAHTTVFVTFKPSISSSSLFFSPPPPRSDPSFVVDSSFLPSNFLGMTVTGSSSWDRNVCDLFNDALGNTFLWNQLGHLSNLLPNLQVTRSLLPPSQILLVFTLSTLLKNVEISLIIIFFTVSPSNPLHVMTQLASSSMGQATLTALSRSSSFFTSSCRAWPRT